MQKLSIALLFILISSCANIMYDRVGNVPKNLENPTLSEKYGVGFWENVHADKLSYRGFARQQCIKARYKNYDGYAVSGLSSSRWTFFGWLSFGKSERTIHIWCKK